jgi:hypothetical protein
MQSLTETSLCGAYQYLSVTSCQVTNCTLNRDLHKKGPSFTIHNAEILSSVPNYLDLGFVTPFQRTSGTNRFPAAINSPLTLFSKIPLQLPADPNILSTPPSEMAER